MPSLNELQEDNRMKDGARLDPKYHQHKLDIVGVPAMEIRDALPALREEILMSTLGGFFASGAFWLGVERLFTVGVKDALFLSCIAFVVAGVVLMIVGVRQGLRRVTRLQKYLPENISSLRSIK